MRCVLITANTDRLGCTTNYGIIDHSNKDTWFLSQRLGGRF